MTIEIAFRVIAESVPKLYFGEASRSRGSALHSRCSDLVSVCSCLMSWRSLALSGWPAGCLGKFSLDSNCPAGQSHVGTRNEPSDGGSREPLLSRNY